MHQKHLSVMKTGYQKVDNEKAENNKETDDNKNIGNNKNAGNDKHLAFFIIFLVFFWPQFYFLQSLFPSFIFFDLETNKTSNKIFSNNANKEIFMLIIKKAKQINLKIRLRLLNYILKTQR